VVKSNNPFSIHNINYLSPSSINTYINDKPLWVMRYLFGMKSSGGASALRGIALEHTLSEKQEKGTFDFDGLDKKFISLCAEVGIDLAEPKCEKERKSLVKFGEVIDKNFKYPKVKGYQERVEVMLDDFPIPIIGYVDFLFDDAVVDLKTTTRLPSQPTEAQLRQMALYSMAYPDKKMHLFFVSPKDHKKFILKSLDKYKNQLKKAALTIQRFLSLSDDKEELANLEYPNTDSWMWSDRMKKEATKIWK
tara:strand:+ start:774 stop:1520 length:747 start_codon:yes stop_codon:yes gene_type:complete